MIFNKLRRANQIKGQALGKNVAKASFCFDDSEELRERVLGHTNIGYGREKNQDAVSAFIVGRGRSTSYIIALADGLGYYQFSERGAYEAVIRVPQSLNQEEDLVIAFAKLHQLFYEAYPYEIKVHMSQVADDRAHQLIAEKQTSQIKVEDRGATTLVLAEVKGNKVRIANVGDSRAYIFREGRIIYQTRDQSMVEFLLNQGRLANDPKQIARHPLRHVLLNAVGGPEPVYEFSENGKTVPKRTGIPQIDEIKLKKGDVILLASDGLFTNLLDEELTRLVSETPWKKLEAAIRSALKHVFRVKTTSRGELPNSDNYTFAVYRHI